MPRLGRSTPNGLHPLSRSLWHLVGQMMQAFGILDILAHEQRIGGKGLLQAGDTKNIIPLLGLEPIFG